MAQTIVVLCDVCLEDGHDTPAVPVTMHLEYPGERTRPMTKDLCAPHLEPYVQAFKDFTTDARRADKAPPLPTTHTPATAGADRVPCPVEGCGATTTPKGLASHVQRVHDMTVSEARGVEPVNQGARGEYPCPECRAEGVERVFTLPQGLGRHRLAKHGVPGVSR